MSYSDQCIGGVAASDDQMHRLNVTRPKLLRATVIVPVYNDPDGIERCLDALAVQSWPADRFDVIVVDNGSEPPLRIEDRYPFAVHVVVCSKPGSYAARNVAAMRATGDVLAFTDADCVPHFNWLREGVQALEAVSGTCLVGGDVVIVLPEFPTAVALYQYIAGFQQKENVQRSGFAITANLFCFKQQFLNWPVQCKTTFWRKP
ncbi:MAG: glycosyltransferase family 2 protein [Gammaproteobacteria bacterium]|nr:glycosyltransferase family 2 protein [Gammaproteobacteria bacterium]